MSALIYSRCYCLEVIFQDISVSLVQYVYNMHIESCTLELKVGADSVGTSTKQAVYFFFGYASVLN